MTPLHPLWSLACLVKLWIPNIDKSCSHTVHQDSSILLNQLPLTFFCVVTIFTSLQISIHTIRPIHLSLDILMKESILDYFNIWYNWLLHQILHLLLIWIFRKILLKIILSKVNFMNNVSDLDLCGAIGLIRVIYIYIYIYSV